MLNGLDLFSGIGGMSIALKQWIRPVAYCEFDPYCQAVILSRIATNDLQNAPIWDDVKTFPCKYSKCIDIIYGGFPCQDISIAGSGKGLAGKRSGLFFEIMRLAQEIKPKFLFLENVPAITSRGGIQVVTEITEMGYDCRWCVISAASVGAVHKRDRWFMLAHSYSQSSGQTNQASKSFKIEKRTRLRSSRQNRGNFSIVCWDEGKCPSLAMDDGLPNELDQSRALGNAVVPIQAEQAFKILMGIK